MMTLSAVAFDLDGTLVDSAPDIQRAVNAALQQAGLRRFDLDTVRSWIGDGPDVLIARALAEQGADADDTSLLARLRADFDAATLAAPLGSGSVYPGIAELLRGLRGRLPIAVVSNKPTRLSRAVLEAAHLLDGVDSVHGADTAALRKPAPQMLLAAAHALGVAPGAMLMVGDSLADMRAARAAGCPAALVGWGYGAHAAAAEPAIQQVATPQAVLALLASALQAPAGTPLGATAPR